MVSILLITLTVTLIYLCYPLFLLVMPSKKSEPERCINKDTGVSLILLTFNGGEFITEKVSFLAGELAAFGAAEFIVVDDHSTDGTEQLLTSLKTKHNLKLILKEKHRGIPHSMNLGVTMATHERIIFCDQRQRISAGALEVIVAPLNDKETGAVSGLISNSGTGNHTSFLRKHENILKRLESLSGNLIGVYGPLYAIRKSCYVPIGERIILDDLFLSLMILRYRRIVLTEYSVIEDDDFLTLYNLDRSRRYLKGFLQLVLNTELIRGLPFRIKIMLVWHKYIRLTIPPLVAACYLFAATRLTADPVARFVFCSISLAGILSLATLRSGWLSDFSGIFRISFYYMLSMLLIPLHLISIRFNSLFRIRRSTADPTTNFPPHV